MRTIGTVARGVRAPIIREGDNIAEVAAASVMEAWKEAGIEPRDRDVVAVTESVVARAAGNYATVQNIADDVKAKFGCDHIGVIFPILSRNRFAIVLRGIATGMKKITLMLSYPSDEVGNHLFDEELLEDSGINPYSDVLTEEEYSKAFGYALHPFTGVDYVDYYKKLIEECGCEADILFANQAEAVLTRVKNVLCCDIHTRNETRDTLAAMPGKTVYTLADVMAAPVDGSGYHDQYGLLGSNKATEEKLKLFPRSCQPVVDAIQARIQKERGISVIYITHDLGVIAQMADDVAVMYCGQVVEMAPAKTLFTDCEFSHPYTEGLMVSIPRLDTPAGVRLESIPGSVPHPLNLPKGCKFAPRCKYCQQRCLEEEPELVNVTEEQQVRCFYPRKEERRANLK